MIAISLPDQARPFPAGFSLILIRLHGELTRLGGRTSLLTTQFDVVKANLRVLTSHARNGDSAAVSTGTLLFSQLSLIQSYSENVVYLDLF